MYGDVHEEVYKWLQEDGINNQKLLLMPRGHLKSHCVAVWCVWKITRDPATSIVYLSAGEDLATVQVDAIKGMITCDRYRKLWPEMINKEEAKRSRWTAWGFNVDHPKRKEDRTRDMTIIVKTVGANFTGLHCDIQVYDDVVVPRNAYSETGRKDVKAAVSQCASIKNAGAVTVAVGTVYHPADVYADFKTATVKHWDQEVQDFTKEEPLWDIKEYVLEDNGDLTGNYLWPSQVSPHNGKTYGFNIREAAIKQGEYFSMGEQSQWYAQYYNRANDVSSEKLNRDCFQYYNEKYIKYQDGYYYFQDKRLSLFAAMDVAWTVNKNSDYTALAVIGVTCDWDVYVLALDRFKTQDYDTYYEHIVGLHSQWGFRKLHIETNAGGTLVAREVKNLLRKNGATLIVDGKAATGNEGKKEEKHAAILVPKVKNGQVFFMKGGLTAVAIEEIVLERPPHDDLKDVLTAAIANATPPSRGADVGSSSKRNIVYHSRFGGRVRGVR